MCIDLASLAGDNMYVYLGTLPMVGNSPGFPNTSGDMNFSSEFWYSDIQTSRQTESDICTGVLKNCLWPVRRRTAAVA